MWPDPSIVKNLGSFIRTKILGIPISNDKGSVYYEQLYVTLGLYLEYI